MSVSIGDLRKPGEVGLQESDLLDRMKDGETPDDITNTVRLVSLGCYCGPKLSFKKIGRGSETLPFDWIRTRQEGLFHFFRNDYDGFFDWSTKQEAGGMKIYRGYYQSFWHDNPTEHAMHERYERRIQRFKEIDATDSLVLFVRSCSTSDELARGPELLEELKKNHGKGAALLMIIDFQHTASGPATIDGIQDLMVYYLSGEAHNNPDGCPYCEPITAALDWAVGRPVKAMQFVDIETIVECCDPTAWGDKGMNGIDAFETEMPPRREKPLPGPAELDEPIAPERRTADFVGFTMPPAGAVTVEVVPESSVGGPVDAPGEPQIIEVVAQPHPNMRQPEKNNESDMMENFNQPGAQKDGITLVSLGCFCGPKLTFQKIGRGAETLPFDWVRTHFDGILHYLRDDFEGFFDYTTRAEVPNSSMVMYRANNHSFWHDNPDSEEMRTKYKRRFARFKKIGESRNPLLFVRAISSMEELLRADKLAQLLKQKFGDQACLLLIADFQRETLGAICVESCEELMVYFLSSKDRAEDHAAPYTKPIKLAIDWLKGEPIEAGCVEDLKSVYALAANCGGGELANFGEFNAFENPGPVAEKASAVSKGLERRDGNCWTGMLKMIFGGSSD